MNFWKPRKGDTDFQDRVHNTRKCFQCGKENPEFCSALMPNGQNVSEKHPEVQLDETHFLHYVLCQDCENDLIGGREPKKQELLKTKWKCLYCGLLNRDEDVFCQNCHAPRRL